MIKRNPILERIGATEDTAMRWFAAASGCAGSAKIHPGERGDPTREHVESII